MPIYQNLVKQRRIATIGVDGIQNDWNGALFSAVWAYGRMDDRHVMADRAFLV